MSEALPETRVLLIRGNQTARRIVLPPFGAVRIGRQEDNDIVLEEPGVDDVHAVLHLDFGIGIEVGSDTSLVVVDSASEARRTLKGPATLDVDVGTRVLIGGAELRVETLDAGGGQRRLLARDCAPDGVDRLHLRVDGAIEEGEAGEVLFGVLGHADTAYDLGEGRFSIALHAPRPEVRDLLVARFKVAGFDVTFGGEPSTAPPSIAASPIQEASTEPFGSLRDELADLEKKRMQQALEKFGNQQEAAKALDIPIRTFVNRMDALGIPRRRAGKKKD